ncbi:MAG: 1-deoxy-D-xylulose-5-phosphate reductoisomerase [bacterium]|nr:1-deoxy-D-xylulose-5-phosphate reductoisomerase [bacterium]
MASPPSRTAVAILGATGSIGTATADVLQHLGAPWKAVALSAHTRLPELAAMCQQLQPEMVAATCDHAFQSFDKGCLPSACQLLAGPQSLVEIAQSPHVDTVVAAVVGSAGLMSTLAAAESGKRVALANKEALVVAGNLLSNAIRQGQGELIPVDSEHSAIFQAIQAGRPTEVERIILTASGGPFRTWSRDRIASATVEDALDHPTWQMGRKITIDSATMMNKALEVIEAHWLFDLPADKIEVVVHPQSVIHSMVEFVDGSVIAQLSPPDMRLPIQYALTFPDRETCPCPKMNWSETMRFDFEPADRDRFPALELGWEVIRGGGTCGAVLNAANEAAVELFLDGQIAFTEIVQGCRRILEEHHFSPNPSLEELLRLDRWARQEIKRWASLV